MIYASYAMAPNLKFVYTPFHGVGGYFVKKIIEKGKIKSPIIYVESQVYC